MPGLLESVAEDSSGDLSYVQVLDYLTGLSYFLLLQFLVMKNLSLNSLGMTL